MASRKLEDLSPVSQAKCKLWLAACKERGLQVLVYCTYRDAKEQDELYKLGRVVVNPVGKSAKKPMGNTVTAAKAWQSFHQWRVAWDAVPTIAGKPLWSGAESMRQYKIMAEEATKLGIEWSGRWKGEIKEVAHFQYTGGLALEDFKNGKTVVA